MLLSLHPKHILRRLVVTTKELQLVGVTGTVRNHIWFSLRELDNVTLNFTQESRDQDVNLKVDRSAFALPEPPKTETYVRNDIVFR